MRGVSDIHTNKLERRLDIALGPGVAERVSGIGEATSWGVAAGFDSRRALLEADRGDLEAVPSVEAERVAARKEL